MNTHDEETKKFFKHSGVRCVLAPRYGASKMSWFRQQVKLNLLDSDCSIDSFFENDLKILRCPVPMRRGFLCV